MNRKAKGEKTKAWFIGGSITDFIIEAQTSDSTSEKKKKKL